MAKAEGTTHTKNGRRSPGSAKGSTYTSKASTRTVHRSATTGRFVSGKASRSTVTSRSRTSRPGSTPSREKSVPPASGGFGCARGLIRVAPDFDDPLEEFDAGS